MGQWHKDREGEQSLPDELQIGQAFPGQRAHVQEEQTQAAAKNRPHGVVEERDIAPFLLPGDKADDQPADQQQQAPGGEHFVQGRGVLLAAATFHEADRQRRIDPRAFENRHQGGHEPLGRRSLGRDECLGGDKRDGGDRTVVGRHAGGVRAVEPSELPQAQAGALRRHTSKK